MSTDRFRLLHLRRLSMYRVRTSVSIIGIASGVALVVAIAALLTSATATANATVALLGGARYEVTVPATDLDRIAQELTSVDGVDGIARFVEVPVMINETQAWLIALDNMGAHLDTAKARALAAVDGAWTGSALPDSGTHRFTGPAGEPNVIAIKGRVDPILEDRYGGRFIATDLETALGLRAGTGTGTGTLLIYGQPDPSSLAAAADLGDIREVENRVVQARNTLDFLFTTLSMLGAMGLVVGGFLLFNTMNMTVLERRSEIASLRALGSDRRSIFTGVLAEAALLGASGSALGLVVGTLMARSVVASVPDAFVQAIGTPLQTSVPIWLLISAWLVGMATSIASAISPARRALKVEPLEALRPSDTDPTAHGVTRRLWLVGFGVALVAIPAGKFALGVATIGLLCITAGSAPLIVSLTISIAQRMGTTGELAASSLRRSPRRVWGTTTVVIVAVGIAVVTASMAENITRTTNTNSATLLNSDFWIGTTTGDTIGLNGLPASWASDFNAIDGVSSVAATSWAAAESGPHLVGIQGVYGDSAYPFSRLANDEARTQMADGEGAIILRQTALTFDLDIGDTLDIPGATPALRLPVVAITDAQSPFSGGMINISNDHHRTYYGTESFARYEIQLDPHADTAEIRRSLDQITEEAGPSIQIHSGAEFLRQFTESVNQVTGLIILIVAVIIACAAIALLNTLLASTLERSNEIAALRALGATKRRIVISIAIEALAMGLTGAVLGAIAGTINHARIVPTFREATAFDIDYAFNPIVVLGAIVIGIAIAAAGAVVPCRKATHINIIDALNR